jgi:hypothetical protein
MNNDIKVTGIVDHEDGSATVTLDLSPETYHKIFEYGFLKLITKGIQQKTGYRDEKDMLAPTICENNGTPNNRARGKPAPLKGGMDVLLYTTRIH